MTHAIVIAVVALTAKAGHFWLHDNGSAGPGPVETMVREAVLVFIASLVAVHAVGWRKTAIAAGLRRAPRPTPPGTSDRETVGPLIENGPSGRPSLWIFVPPLLVVAGWGIVAVTRGGFTRVPIIEALRVVVAAGTGEELIFRGAVLGLALRRGSYAAFCISSAAFGLWHLPDAVGDLCASWKWQADVLFVLATVVVMAVVGWVLFANLRFLGRLIWAPVLLHISWNLGAVFVFGTTPAVTRC